MRQFAKVIFALAFAGCVTTAVQGEKPAQDAIVSHPDQLVFPSLEFQLPAASQFREVLPSGMVVYIAEDRMLPTFDMIVLIRTGGAFDPPAKAGLASLTGEQLRDGGMEKLSPEDLDERVEFLAATLSSRIGDERGSASLAVLSKDIDEGLALLVDMLRHPRFDEERLRKAKERALQNIKRRNDATRTIEAIEWGFLMDGADHYSNRYRSSESIKAITRDDLVAFHRKYYHPGNMMVSVAGDFDRQEMLKKIEKAFGDWPVGEPAPKTFAAPVHEPVPGVYMVDKQEVNQGRVSIGHKSIMRGTPDEFALRLMNAILGGSGFQSRLVAKVRSDEGLAYSVFSQFGQGVYYPDSFRCAFQSKSNSCAYATKLVLDEIERIRSEKVGQEEFDNAVSLLVEFFPQRFPSRMSLLRTYLADEYTGRAPAYWQTYVEQLKSVTLDDVLRVAGEYLHPDRLVILAVGETEALLAGGTDKAPDLRFDRFGKVTKLPLRDPDTLKR